jgi:hypothetical protein
MKQILAVLLTLALLSAAQAADWQYDSRRCAVGHEVGDFYFRISSLYPVEFDIVKNLDRSGVDFKVASVWIDQVDFAARSGDAFEYSLGPGKPLCARWRAVNGYKSSQKGRPSPLWTC